jgi:hypothetical protein
MSQVVTQTDEIAAKAEARAIFAREIGAHEVPTQVTSAGNESFLKFIVGREAPIYRHALRETQRALSTENPFRGALGLSFEKTERFPESLEATALLTLLTPSTRVVAQDTTERGFSVPYVPFQNHEDFRLAQPASHVVVGRRGVGKSTLIRSAVKILKASAAIVAVVDFQAYSTLAVDDLAREIMQDIVNGLVQDASRVSTIIVGQSTFKGWKVLLPNWCPGKLLRQKPYLKSSVSSLQLQKLLVIAHSYSWMISISLTGISSLNFFTWCMVR